MSMTQALCWCGHRENVHVPCGLGALLSGVWGCVECGEDFIPDQHIFSPAPDKPGGVSSRAEDATPSANSNCSVLFPPRGRTERRTFEAL